MMVPSKIDKVGCAEEMSVVQGLQMRGTYMEGCVFNEDVGRKERRDTWTMLCDDDLL